MCRSRMVAEGAIIVTCDERGEVFYTLPATSRQQGHERTAQMNDAEIAYRAEQDAYLTRLEAGMCPHCQSMHTQRVESLYQACAERYCRDCGQQYAAEW